MRISYSAFENYNGCPARYKFQYVDRISVPKKTELVFGSLMHAVVDMALKRDPIIPPIQELEKFFNLGFANVPFKDSLSKKQYSAVGKEMIKTFHRSLTPGLRTTLATEKRFAIDLNDKHSLVGIIDRIDKLPFGAFEVIDYKTNFKPKTQDEVDQDKQLGVYKFATEHFWPEAKDVRLSLFYLRSNQKLTTTRDEEGTKILIDEIIATADKIESDNEWKPKKNPLCGWCDFQHLCPLMSEVKVIGPEIANDLAEYIEAARKIELLEPKIIAHFADKKIDSLRLNESEITLLKNGKLSVNKNNL